MRWVGIDEAGYGPNLGPLVMTAVVAESPDDRPPDVWGDLASTVSRAGCRDHRLWVDDSKRVYRGGMGLDRLDAAALAVLGGVASPSTLGELLAALGAKGRGDDAPGCGLGLWCDGQDPPWPSGGANLRLAAVGDGGFDAAPWKVVSVRSIVLDPASFNSGLARVGGTKADLHFHVFTSLLGPIWESARAGETTIVRGDKHGGRHFYFDRLADAFPEVWIDRGEEGPALSRYTLRGDGRRLELGLRPRADADDGLVALASMVSKALREHWMAVFNAHWQARLPDLRATAGYPADAARFRAAIEPLCEARGLARDQWWRAK